MTAVLKLQKVIPDIQEKIAEADVGFILSFRL